VSVGDRRFYGKYRGTVFDNEDPKMLGRLQALVPDVLGQTPSSWALPCLPMAGTGTPMGVFCVPPIDTGVWIEFEHGDLDWPIWSGCWFTEGAPPTLTLASPPPISQMVIQTQGGMTLSLSDAPGPQGGILLRTTGGAMISINDVAGIIISNGKGANITVNGPTVSINGTALVVAAP
jgi:uncharacterized protein involved in type VI secretion and phage assembly